MDGAIDGSAEDAADDEEEAGVGRLTVRIEERDEQQSRDGAADHGKRRSKGDDNRAARAAMRVGEVPLAAGTSRHERDFCQR